MKKTVFLFHTVISFSLFLSLLSTGGWMKASERACDTRGCESHFTGALTAGYVFKHDCRFKEVYGHGMVNILTADGCYYPWQQWGIGAKVSYWRAQGQTTFVKRHSRVQEVPITFYVRRIKDFCGGLRAYASLGGGVTLIKEKSYLGTAKLHKGIGEVEVGVAYPVWHCLNITGAFRYLFPRQSSRGSKADVGGCDLRAGIGFSF